MALLAVAQDDVDDVEDNDSDRDVTELDADAIPQTAEEACFVVREVRNFDALTDEFVYVEGAHDEEFLLTMFSRCVGLRNAFGIAVSSRMSRVCSNSSAEITYREFGGRLATCLIAKVEGVEDKATAEALVESRSRED